ncbi:formin-like protein 16 [Penaeus monodon]|uniref:formin-like protein 16 n=1 Tax=Penaeus monodon TaxID=6687 RepID=UPI0018A73E85|nr:formin-like protein 16 [Penaeus monodon]
MGSLNQLAAFLLLISVAHSVKLRQECDIGLQVGCPSETDGRPWVSCSRVACSVTTNKTWFIGILYKRVDCLEEDGKMVKVEYQRQGRLSCSLVPIQTNPELLQAYLSSANSTCESSVPTSGAPASGTSVTPASVTSLTPASATSGVPASATSGASTSATSGALPQQLQVAPPQRLQVPPPRQLQVPPPRPPRHSPQPPPPRDHHQKRLRVPSAGRPSGPHASS